MRHDVFVNTIMCIYTHYLQISIFMSIFSCFQCDCWTRRLKQNYLFRYLQNLGTQGAPAALPPVSCLHSAAHLRDTQPAWHGVLEVSRDGTSARQHHGQCHGINVLSREESNSKKKKRKPLHISLLNENNTKIKQCQHTSSSLMFLKWSTI